MMGAATQYGERPGFYFPVTYRVRFSTDQDSKNLTGQELPNTNAQALDDLYGAETGGGTYTYQSPRDMRWDPRKLIEIVHHYEYRVSACNNWRVSDARHFCASLGRQLLHPRPWI